MRLFLQYEKGILHDLTLVVYYGRVHKVLDKRSAGNNNLFLASISLEPEIRRTISVARFLHNRGKDIHNTCCPQGFQKRGIVSFKSYVDFFFKKSKELCPANSQLVRSVVMKETIEVIKECEQEKPDA